MVASDHPQAERRRPVSDRLVSPVLVGRDAETDALLKALDDPPRLVLITGDAGMGKTRLCEALLAHPNMRGRRVLQGRCHQLSDPFPFGPLIEALRRGARLVRKDRLGAVAGALAPFVPELADRLPPPLPALDDPGSERHRMFRALADLLSSMGPADLFLEDLHWADEATIEFLTFLGAELPKGLCIVGTLREDETTAASPSGRLLTSGVAYPKVELWPMGMTEVRSMVSAILETDVSEEFAEFIHDRSGGIPFAVEELVRLLQEREDLTLQSGRWVRHELEDIRAPAGLTAPVVERLGRLTPQAQRVVQAAAVAGEPVAPSFLHAIASESSPSALTEAMEAKLLVDSGGSIGFRHSLARHAVDQSIPSSIRRMFHLRAARELERSEAASPVRLARHFREAAEPAPFLRCSEAAADQALEHGDDAAAARILAEALTEGEATPSERARLALKLGGAALHGLEHETAIPLLEELVGDELIPAAKQAEIRMSLSFLLWQGGEARAIDQIEAAIDHLEDPVALMDAMCGLAWPGFPRGTVQDHLGWMERAGEVVRGVSDPVARMRFFHDEAFLLILAGDRRGAANAARIPVDVSTAGGRREYIRGRVNIGAALAVAGHDALALRYTREGLDLSRKFGYERFVPPLEVNECQVHFGAGLWDGLPELLDDVIRRSADAPGTSLHARAIRGALSLARGDVARAEALMGDGPPVLDELKPSVFALAQAWLARVADSRGEPERAANLVRQVISVTRRKGFWLWAAPVMEIAAEVLPRTGRRDEAELLVEEFRAGIRGRDAPFAAATLAGALGLLAEDAGDVVEALRCFREASELYSAIPRPVEANAQRGRMGRVLLATDAERGRMLLQGAVRNLDRMGASWEAAQIRSGARRLGVTLHYRGGRRGYGTALSPRELEVSRLALDLSNREVAERLFVSVKTVEKHLASAMRKLQATGRAELAERLPALERNHKR